jgi:hypothetical protein
MFLHAPRPAHTSSFVAPSNTGGRACHAAGTAFDSFWRLFSKILCFKNYNETRKNDRKSLHIASHFEFFLLFFVEIIAIMNVFSASTTNINPSWNTINHQTVVQVKHRTSFDNNEVVANEVVPHEVPTVTTAPVAEVEVVSNKYDNIQWVDCDFDEEGKPTGLQGKLWNQLSVAKLRIIC